MGCLGKSEEDKREVIVLTSSQDRRLFPQLDPAFPTFPLNLRMAAQGLEPPAQSCISHRLKRLRKNGGRCRTGAPRKWKEGLLLLLAVPWA